MAADNQIFKSFSEAHNYLNLNKNQFQFAERKTFYTTFSKPSVSASQSQGKSSAKSLKRRQLQQTAVRRRNDEAFNRLKVTVDTGGDPLDLQAAIAEMKTFGWYADPRLPPGWLKFNPIKLPIQYLIFHPFCSRFLNKQAAVSGLRSKMAETLGGVEREHVIKFILGDSDIEHSLNTENDLDWEENHSSVPRGWKIRKDKANSDPLSVEILSPERICFKDRLSAYRLMKMDFSEDLFKATEIESLKKCLVHEGWEDHSLIPSGWKVNRTEQVSLFLTSDGAVLRDQDAARSFVMDSANKVSIEERKNLMDADDSLFYSPTPRTPPAPQLSGVARSPRPAKLPPDWKMESLHGKLIKITASDGQTFYSRLQALEHMLDTEQEPELTCSMWESLTEEDWTFGLTFVPPCWAVRWSLGQLMFLTKELVVLASVEEALEYIEMDDEYEPVSYKILNDWWEIFLGATWVEDRLLPAGWKKTEIRMETEEEDTQAEHFLAPSGDIFTDKVSMIRHLIDKEYSTENISRIWNSLDTESWMVDTQQVPLGWKIRFDCELNQDEYLSPRMEVLKSREDILKLTSLTDDSDESDKLMSHYIEQWSKLSL